MKQLSIITICYNEPKLEETCQSIVNQTWQDFEWVVIDGGSDEKTQKIWDKYKHRIDKFISERDNGIYDACNKGIELANGKYLNFMNAGDSYNDENVLFNVSDLFENNENDVIFGNSFYMFHSGGEKNFLKTFPLDLNKSFFYNDNLNTQAVFVKKELFMKYGKFDTSYKICADWDRWLNFISEKRSFKHIPIIAAKYNMEGLSNSVNYEFELKQIQKKYFSKKELKKLKYGIEIENYKLIEKIFSVKNSIGKKYKILTILGIHIKLKRREK